MYISGKYLDYNKKLIEVQSRIASLSTKNESLTIQISALVDEVKKDKDRLKTLEKNIDIEKEFSKLKDKQIDEALVKVDKAGFEAVEKFKASDELSDRLYNYYVMVSSSFVSIWQSIILGWPSLNLTWKRWRRNFWRIILLKLSWKNFWGIILLEWRWRRGYTKFS